MVSNYWISWAIVCHLSMASKMSPKMETLLEPLHNSHVYFSVHHFGRIERVFLEYVSPRCTLIILNQSWAKISQKNQTHLLNTKFTNVFLYFSSLGNSTVVKGIPKPGDLHTRFWGYRDPLAAVYISSHFPSFSLFSGFRIKPTVLAATLDSIHLICVLCSPHQLGWKLTHLENLEATWRQILLTKGNLMYLNTFMRKPLLDICNLSTQRYYKFLGHH